ncbi:protein ROH1 [Trifolium repens]|nr:protein ROH1 [Trifolium repens]
MKSLGRFFLVWRLLRHVSMITITLSKKNLSASSTRVMNELTHSLHFPLSEQKEEEVRVKVQDVVNVLEGFKDGLDPLERQVREVFHGIVRGRIWKG